MIPYLKANFEYERETLDETEEAEVEEISEWEGFQQEDLVDAMLDLNRDASIFPRLTSRVL